MLIIPLIKNQVFGVALLYQRNYIQRFLKGWINNYNLTKSSNIVYKHYNLLNGIRFGPDEPESLENEMQNMTRFSDSRQFQLLECASLANNMNLFDKLL